MTLPPLPIDKLRQDNLPQSVRDALEYLKTGGLGEVIGFTSIALNDGSPKVQSDTDMAMALCLLASDGLDSRSKIEALSRERDEAVRYATNFLVAYVNKYCSPVASWAPLPDIIGLLTQLDNASTVTAGILARAEAAERKLATLTLLPQGGQ